MIIILKKDGQIVTDDGNPVEGAKLENAAAVLADPKDGDTIVYNADAGMWVAGTVGDSFEPDITNPQDGDTLVYDASEEKWVNGSGGGSVGGILKVGMNPETGALDKTWKEIHDVFAFGWYCSIMFTMPAPVGVPFDGIQTYTMNTVVHSPNGYEINAFRPQDVEIVNFITDSENGYPVLQQD